jgi:tetratricopeptide repeat protein
VTGGAGARPDPLHEASAALGAGELDRALHRVSHALRRDPHTVAVYDLAARILEEKGGHDRQGLLFRMCADHFDEARHFYRLGFEFMAADLPTMARPVLARAWQLDPDNTDIRTEYAVALAETGDHARALTILSGLDRRLIRSHPSIRFLEGWCRLLTGDLPGAEQALAALDTPAEGCALEPTLRERLALGTARMRAIGCPGPRDIAGWHFIQYGSALLATSSTPATGGRFGLLAETYQDLGRRLAALVAFVKRLPFAIHRVTHPADQHDSIILGRALATRLAIPHTPLDPGDPPDPGSLLVAAGAENLAPWTHLHQRQPAVVVYAHRLIWTHSAPLVPDVVGLMAQAYFFPWNATFVLDPIENRAVERPRDHRPPEEIADHLASHIPSDVPPDLAERLSFFEQNRNLSLHGGDARVTLRPPFRQESPVAGTRFD